MLKMGVYAEILNAYKIIVLVLKKVTNVVKSADARIVKTINLKRSFVLRLKIFGCSAIIC
jgi:hypothetical protein